MPGKRVAIVQSSYIPWKGYFDLIRAVDEFILLDDVQFTKRDWRSRNQIKTQHGIRWLTVPVRTKGLYSQLIQDTYVSERCWGEKHWQTLRSSYGRTPFFRAYADAIAGLYAPPDGDERLSDVNERFIRALCTALGIGTPIRRSSDYPSRHSGRNERLIALCRDTGATDYLSGPSARGYLDEALFGGAGIRVQFADYSGYPEYAQPWPPFAHGVSAVDLLFCTGPDAKRYMKSL